MVLSAGGMFGAYQAGAWMALSEFFRPDVVVGASIGSINGWVIAGGASPQEWVNHWLNLEEASKHRFHFPRSLREGVLDAGPFYEWVRTLCGMYTPRVPFGAVITELPRLRACLVQTPQVTWEHLAASCAVIGLFPQLRIDGKVWTDGGLVNALPVWAAAVMGADRVVAINVWKGLPPLFSTMMKGVKALAGRQPGIPDRLRLVTLEPRDALGDPRAALYWQREPVRRWVDAGYEEALKQKHSIQELFESY